MQPVIIKILVKHAAICLAPVGGFSGTAKAENLSNILFVLADDFGIDSLRCYGADDFNTPHIEALACGGTQDQITIAERGHLRGVLHHQFNLAVDIINLGGGSGKPASREDKNAAMEAANHKLKGGHSSKAWDSETVNRQNINGDPIKF